MKWLPMQIAASLVTFSINGLNLSIPLTQWFLL